MKRRYIQTIALFWAVGLLLPCTLHAEDEGPNNTGNTAKGVVLKKTVDEDPNDSKKFTITLDAYATGTKITTITETAVPVDLMLVLDVSTSMAASQGGQYLLSSFQKLTTGDNIGILHTEISDVNGSKCNYHNTDNKSTRYKIQIGDTMYYLWYNEKARNGKQAGWYYGSEYNGWNNGTNWTIYDRNDSADIIYTDVKIDLLQEACRVFLDELLTNAKGKDGIPSNEDDVDIRVGISTFCGSLMTDNNYDIVSVVDNYDALLNKINNLHTHMGGSTDPSKALNDAYTKYQTLNKKLSNNIADRSRVVVMFTDGEPTVGVDGILNSASYLKTNTADGKTAVNASLYTIGIFGKDIDNNKAGSVTIRKYMELVSSTYPKAKSTTNTGAKNTDGITYFYEDTGAQLSEIFRTIASESIEQGDIYDLEESSLVVVDMLTPFFKLPDGYTTTNNNITVYAVDCTGKLNDEYQFDVSTQHPIHSQAELNNATGNFKQNVQVAIKDKTVAVTGYDFKEFYVGEENTVSSAGTTTTYRGMKLVIKIPIEVDPANPGGAQLVTNDPRSGIYADATIDNWETKNSVSNFEQPEVTLPNIIIIKNGMAAGESASFLVTKVTDAAGNTVDNSFTPFTVVLTGKEDANGGKLQQMAKIKLQVEGRYKVTETTWAWRYNPVPLQANTYKTDVTGEYATKVGSNYVVRTVNKATEEEINVIVDGKERKHGGTLYYFANTEKNSTQIVPSKYSEAEKNNVFNIPGKSSYLNDSYKK